MFTHKLDGALNTVHALLCQLRHLQKVFFQNAHKKRAPSSWVCLNSPSLLRSLSSRFAHAAAGRCAQPLLLPELKAAEKQGEELRASCCQCRALLLEPIKQSREREKPS